MKMDKNKPQKSFSEYDPYNNREAENKFELIRCPHDGKNCKNHLTLINKDYTESNFYLQNKEYHESIEALNSAFTKTFKLQEETCAQCAKTFRYTIIQTLQNIQMDLYNMSNGMFKTNRYKSSYIFAGNVLDRLRQNGE